MSNCQAVTLHVEGLFNTDPEKLWLMGGNGGDFNPPKTFYYKRVSGQKRLYGDQSRISDVHPELEGVIRQPLNPESSDRGALIGDLSAIFGDISRVWGRADGVSSDATGCLGDMTAIVGSIRQIYGCGKFH
ncbi:MAG: hypothetical protein IT292_06425 [Deltaproteobacteria bacterium]|nr:hypothetical protein [Deltaproteobacteria bacterium]